MSSYVKLEVVDMVDAHGLTLTEIEKVIGEHPADIARLFPVQEVLTHLVCRMPLILTSRVLN